LLPQASGIVPSICTQSSTYYTYKRLAACSARARKQRCPPPPRRHRQAEFYDAAGGGAAVMVARLGDIDALEDALGISGGAAACAQCGAQAAAALAVALLNGWQLALPLAAAALLVAAAILRLQRRAASAGAAREAESCALAAEVAAAIHAVCTFSPPFNHSDEEAQAPLPSPRYEEALARSVNVVRRPLAAAACFAACGG